MSTTETKPNDKNANSKIILMGFSEIKDGFAEAAYGTFETVGDAEKKGRLSFKNINWLVARRISRRNGQREEVTYDYLTDVQKPRRGYED